MQKWQAIRGTAGLIAAVGLSATAASAQEEGGLRLSFGIEQRLEFGRNLDLDVPAEGSSKVAATVLSFGLLTETGLDRLEFTASGALVIENSPDTVGTEIDFGRPEVRFAYVREVPDALFSITARYLSDDVGALAEDLADSDADGTEIDYGVTLRYEAFRTSAASLFVEADFDGTEYKDTTDPSLLDTDTYGLTVGTRLRFSEVMFGTLSVGQSREDEEGGLITDTTTVRAGLDYAMANGSASVGLIFDSSDDEDRTTLEFGRTVELPAGSVSGRLGVSQSDVGGSDLVGGIDWTQDLPDGALTVSVDRSASFDRTTGETTVETGIAVGWERVVNDLSSVGLDLTWDISDASSERIEETEIGATYSYALTADASLDVGMRYRVREDLGGRAESPLVFLALGRTF